MQLVGKRVARGCAAVLASLVISGCIEGERMLTVSQRVHEIENGTWCELDKDKISLVDNCETFEWRDGLYHAGRRLFAFKRVRDDTLIGEYTEIDSATGEPKQRLWAKFVVVFDQDNRRMANVGDDEFDFQDFLNSSKLYAHAHGLELGYDAEFDTWDLYGTPNAMRQFMTDLAGHLDPEKKRYFKLAAETNSSGSYPLQIAKIAKGTTYEAYVAKHICLAGVKRAKAEKITVSDIPAIKKIFEACDAIQGLKLREHAALAGLMWTDSKISQADEHYQKAIQSPDGVRDRVLRHETMQNWGAMHFSNENYTDAIRIFSRLLDENPKHLEALQYRGLAHRRVNDHPNAIADYTTTIDVANELNRPLEIAIAYMRRGYVHQLDGRLDDAQRDNVIALQLEPSLSYAHSNMGAIAEARGDRAGAKAHYEKAIELNNKNSHPLEGLKRLK